MDENAKLCNRLTLLHGQLEDTNAELERLRSLLELRSSHALSVAATRVQDLEVQTEQLTAKNSELEHKYHSMCEDLNTQADKVEGEHDEQTKLEVERLQWEQQRASHEKSESRAEVLEEREEREVIKEVHTTVASFFPRTDQVSV